MKLKIILITLLAVVLLVAALFSIKVPCGGMTEDGVLWDGECLLICSYIDCF